MQLLLTVLFPGDRRRSIVSLAGRAVLLLVLIVWTWPYFTVRLVDLGQDPGVMHLVHLVFHEAGHTITALLTDNRTLIVFITQGIPRANLKDVIDLLDRVSSRTFEARAKGREAMEQSKSAVRPL